MILGALLLLVADALACSVGTNTTMATACANVYKPGAPNHVIPWEPAIGPVHRDLVTPAVCQQYRIVRIYSTDRLARVKCMNPASTEEVVVNIDFLSCNANNVTRVPPRMELLEEAYGCPVPQDGPLRELATRISRSGEEISRAAAQTLVRRARERFVQVQMQVERDNLVVQDAFEALGAGGVSRFEDATREMRRLADLALARYRPTPPTPPAPGRPAPPPKPPCSGPGPSQMTGADKVRGQRTCKLLAATANLGERILADANAARAAAGGNTAAGNAAYLGVIQDRVMAGQISQDASIDYDQLALRQLLFQSLPPTARNEMARTCRISFARRSIEAVPENQLGGVPLIELHTGYVFGGSRIDPGTGCHPPNTGRPYDCSDLVSQLIREGSSRRPIDSPSTDRFRDMARYLNHERGVAAPSDPQDRALMSCFVGVDLRIGQEPRAGDLVIQRNDGIEGSGHIVLATGYDSSTGEISTFEAAGSDINTLTDRVRRPIFEPSCRSPASASSGGQVSEAPMSPWRNRPVRPDVQVLRFKAHPPSSCPFRPDPA